MCSCSFVFGIFAKNRCSCSVRVHVRSRSNTIFKSVNLGRRKKCLTGGAFEHYKRQSAQSEYHPRSPHFPLEKWSENWTNLHGIVRKVRKLENIGEIVRKIEKWWQNSPQNLRNSRVSENKKIVSEMVRKAWKLDQYFRNSLQNPRDKHISAN